MSQRHLPTDYTQGGHQSAAVIEPAEKRKEPTEEMGAGRVRAAGGGKEVYWFSMKVA